MQLTREAKQLTSVQRGIQADPNWFVRRFAGDEPWLRQQQIIQSVFDNPITTVRSCHGIGKSWLSAKVALAFLTAYTDSYVITTAPTYRQVENIIWRDMRATYNGLKIPIGGRMFANARLDMADEWFAMGFAAKDPDKFQGFHAPSGHILVITDEAAGIPEDIWVAIDAILSSEGARLLMIGNPTSLSGRFFQSHHTDTGATRFHVSCFDTPNFTNNGIRNVEDLRAVDLDTVELVAPYLITPAWVKDKITKWGVESPMFQARCLGQFPSAEINTLIPLNLLEEAATPERREELQAKTDQLRFIGVDPARYGDDKSVIAERNGGVVEPLQVHGKEDTTQTAGRVRFLKPADGIFIDVDGVGGGVADILRDDKVDNIVDLHGSASPQPDSSGVNFVNLRAQVYWNLAERFKAGEISIPEGDLDLIAQLSSIRYKITRRGIQIEEKAEIKKRLLVSPDKADALAYCFADFLVDSSKVAPSIGKSYDSLYNNTNADW